MISDELARAIDAFAQHPHVLVACDYDGTLAPIVDNPGHARPIRESIVAMRALAELHATDTAVISGRSLRDLAALSRMPDEVHLVGSHGSEFDVGFESDLSHEVRSHLATLVAALAIVAADFPGSMVESKPAGAAFHVRRVDAAEPLRKAVRFRVVGDDVGLHQAGRPQPPRRRVLAYATASGSSSSRSSRPTRVTRSKPCATGSAPMPCSSSATTRPTRTPSRSYAAPMSR